MQQYPLCTSFAFLFFGAAAADGVVGIVGAMFGMDFLKNKTKEEDERCFLLTLITTHAHSLLVSIDHALQMRRLDQESSLGDMDQGE